MPDRMSENMPEDMPDRAPEDMPEQIAEDMPARMPEDMPDRVPEDMPDKMPEGMSDRMPEDLPVTKCINVMVGITRSKVITYLLRVIPTLPHYSDIASDTQYGSICWIYIYIYSEILSDILCGIYADILSGILSGIYSNIPGIYSGILFWHSFLPLYLTSHWDLALAVEVWQCPLRFGGRSWGPTEPGEI